MKKEILKYYNENDNKCEKCCNDMAHVIMHLQDENNSLYMQLEEALEDNRNLYKMLNNEQKQKIKDKRLLDAIFRKF